MPPRRASARNASAAAASPAAAAAASSPSSSLFAGLTIAVAGKFARSLAELKEIVTTNGGEEKGNDSCAHATATKCSDRAAPLSDCHSATATVAARSESLAGWLAD